MLKRLLQSKLKPAIRMKRIGLLTKGFFCATIMRDFIQRLHLLKQSGSRNISFSHALIWCGPSSIEILHVWVTKRNVAKKKICE
jgi:hypothetical protein